MLPVGRYVTKSGSTMRISGQYGGKSEANFDWLEEDACYDCKPEPYDVDGYLVWHCDECGGGKAKLEPAI